MGIDVVVADLLKALKMLVAVHRALDTTGALPADKAIAYGYAEAAIAKAALMTGRNGELHGNAASGAAATRFKNCPLCGSPPVIHAPVGPHDLGAVSCSGKNDRRCILQGHYQDETNAHVTFDRWPKP